MRVVRGVLTALLLTAPAVARADLLTRALDDTGGGGGGSSAPASNPTDPDDLLSWAGRPQPITLPQLLQFAVQQAPALATARLDIAVAQAQIEQTWARHDWLFGAQGQAARSGGVLSGLAIDSRTQLGVSADVTRALPTGGTVGLHVASQYSKVQSSSFNSTTWFDEVTGSITQPLFRGRGGFLFDAPERRAELVRDAAVLGRRLAAIQTVQAVVSAYWDLVLAQRQVAITEASLALARERLRVTEIGARGGKIADAEIPAVQQVIATREEDVLSGELAVLDRSIALRRAAGMPIGQDQLGLQVAPELDIREQTWNLGDLIDRTFSASPGLAQLAKQDQNATLEIDVNDNGLLPQLDAALSLGPTGQSDTFGTAAKNLVEFKQLAITGSLTFSRALHQSDVRGRSRELRAGREKLRVTATDVRAQLAQAMTQAVAQLQLAQRRVDLSQRAIELANENIRIETDRFNLGKSTNFDVLNRLEEERQAELRKAQAMIDWHKAETVVQALTGDILPAFGITVD